MPSPFAFLPDQFLDRLLTYLDPEVLVDVRVTCKRMREGTPAPEVERPYLTDHLFKLIRYLTAVNRQLAQFSGNPYQQEDLLVRSKSLRLTTEHVVNCVASIDGGAFLKKEQATAKELMAAVEHEESLLAKRREAGAAALGVLSKLKLLPGI